MKPMTTLASLGALVLMALTLVACGRTSNSGTPANLNGAQCTRTADGRFIDMYGRACNNYPTSNCGNARYVNGQYYDAYTGAPISCGNSFFDGYNSVPYYGQYQGQNFQGCQGWSSYYPGTQYIPMDIGNGQMVCMNMAYLYNYYPNYNWGNVYNNYAMYGRPMYACMSYDCMGGYYNNYNYSCMQSFNIGFNFGWGGMGFGMCY